MSAVFRGLEIGGAKLLSGLARPWVGRRLMQSELPALKQVIQEGGQLAKSRVEGDVLSLVFKNGETRKVALSELTEGGTASANILRKLQGKTADLAVGGNRFTDASTLVGAGLTAGTAFQTGRLADEVFGASVEQQQASMEGMVEQLRQDRAYRLKYERLQKLQALNAARLAATNQRAYYSLFYEQPFTARDRPVGTPRWSTGLLDDMTLLMATGALGQGTKISRSYDSEGGERMNVSYGSQ